MRAASVAGWVLWLGLASAGLAEETAGTSYGGGVTLDESTALPALLAAPQDHVGQVVRIDGVATEICREHGDWLKVSVPRGGSGILVSLGESFTVPRDSATRRVAVHGEWVAVPTVEDYGGEPDAPLDQAHACPAMTRGEVRYRMRGTGVVVY